MLFIKNEKFFYFKLLNQLFNIIKFLKKLKNKIFLFQFNFHSIIKKIEK